MEPTSRVARLLLVVLLLVPLAGCEVIGGIFKAGVWVGVILAALVVVGIVWMVTKARG
jgi:hypothetical protein